VELDEGDNTIIISLVTQGLEVGIAGILHEEERHESDNHKVVEKINKHLIQVLLHIQE
jgi:hypothetical protein